MAHGHSTATGHPTARSGHPVLSVDGHTASDPPVERVAIWELRPAAMSPRRGGEDPEHVRTLAASEDPLPPILVHRKTMGVIDGMHRLRAAMASGASTISVVYFDGDEMAAFIAAVEANVTHGLPLPLADRKAAAERILQGYPHWSDRAIAKITGLSARTVALIRCPTEEMEQLDKRVGTDGRERPLRGESGRLRAAAVIRSRPNLPLREVARRAGISPTTAGDVRARLSRGEDPLRPGRGRARDGHTGQPDDGKPATHDRRDMLDVHDPETILGGLRNDPSLRYTEAGRSLLRQLDLQVRGFTQFIEGSRSVPDHCRYILADLAKALAARWQDCASRLVVGLDGRGPLHGRNHGITTDVRWLGHSRGRDGSSRPV